MTEAGGVAAVRPNLVFRRLVVGGIAACVAAFSSFPAAGASRGGVRLPPAAARADYQLGGNYPLPAGVKIVSRDRLSAPAPGAYNICYVNAFQTQPEQLRWWKRVHPGLLLRNHAGALVEDPQWPGELLLNIGTPATRVQLAGIMRGWITGCAAHGFAAVEPDNLDSWTRSQGLLTRSAAVAFARLLISAAHRKHLAIAQKNTSELAPTGRALGFDFAVAEDCQAYAECAAYTDTYGAHVLEIEYSDNGHTAFQQACAARAGTVSIIYRDRLLTRPGNPHYAYAAC